MLWYTYCMAEPRNTEKYLHVRAIYANHPDWSYERIAELAGTTPTTVKRYIDRIKLEGDDPDLAPSLSASAVSKDTDKYEEALAAIKDPEKLIEIAASYLANPATPIPSRVRIMEFIAARQRDTGAAQTLPPPTSLTEQIDRAALILEALGREHLSAVLTRAFGAESVNTTLEAPLEKDHLAELSVRPPNGGGDLVGRIERYKLRRPSNGSQPSPGTQPDHRLPDPERPNGDHTGAGPQP